MGYVCTLDLFPAIEQRDGEMQLDVLQERSKVTEYLIGQKEVQTHVVDYQGEKALLFVFAVRRSTLCLLFYTSKNRVPGHLTRRKIAVNTGPKTT